MSYAELHALLPTLPVPTSQTRFQAAHAFRCSQKGKTDPRHVGAELHHPCRNCQTHRGNAGARASTSSANGFRRREIAARHLPNGAAQERNAGVFCASANTRVCSRTARAEECLHKRETLHSTESLLARRREKRTQIYLP